MQRRREGDAFIDLGAARARGSRGGRGGRNFPLKQLPLHGHFWGQICQSMTRAPQSRAERGLFGADISDISHKV